MPKGPQGQKRPADFMANAVLIGKIATGQITDSKPLEGKEYHQKGGRAGGRARAENLSAKRLKEIAKKAAKSRWNKKAKK